VNCLGNEGGEKLTLNRNLFVAIIIIIVLGISNVYFFLTDTSPTQQAAQAPKPAPSLEKFKAFSPRDWEVTFPIIDAGKDRGLWAKHGLDPEWRYTTPGSSLVVEAKQLLEEGFKIGFASTSIPLIRADGVPIKIVAGIQGKDSGNRLYVKADSPIKTVKDLNGKKVGVPSFTNPEYRNTLYITNKFGIKPELVLTENVTNSIVYLKLGKVDAFYTFSPAALRLVDSGELRVLARLADFQRSPMVNAVIWAADDLIEKDPGLVQRLVRATLEIVVYLKENPTYLAELYQKRTNAPIDVAEKAVSELFYTPEGRGEGVDLVLSVRNSWEFQKDSGAIPASIWEKVKVEDAVDVRFLP